MSIENNPRERRFEFIEQRLKKGGVTPEYINRNIPTDPIRLRFGPGKGTSSKAASPSTHFQGSAWLMGTRYLVGTPFDIMYQFQKVRLTTATPNVWVAFVHSRNPGGLTSGTFDITYLPTRSDDLTIGDLDTIWTSLPPGTFKVYVLGAGSTQSSGKGSLIKFQGFGSVGAAGQGVGFVGEYYPL